MIEIRHPLTGRLVARFGLDWQAVDKPLQLPRIARHSDDATEDRRARAGEVGK